jgi:hypothetical protein
MSNKSKSPHSSPKKPLHRSLTMWLAVLLMLIAMAVYLGTMDESVPPPEAPQPPVPAGS